MIFVDTNYFLRFFLADSEEQYRIAKKLISEAAVGRFSIFTSTIVVFEIYWVLRSYYQRDKKQIFETLEDFLDLAFIQLEERERLRRCLEMFRNSNLSLMDCYNLVFARDSEAKVFKTFDKKLAKYFP